MRVCMLFLKIYVTFVRREQKRMNKRENNMKRFLYLTVCLLILGEFYGCNGDVFVDDFRPSDSVQRWTLVICYQAIVRIIYFILNGKTRNCIHC